VLVGGGGAQIVDNMMQVVSSGSGLTSGLGAYYVFSATPVPVPVPRPSAISFSPPSLTFSQNVNTTSSPQTITVTNVGGSPINGLSIATSGVFSQTNNCPSVLVAATSCTVSVWFAPSAAGSVTGSLTVRDDSYNLGSSQIVILNGTGTFAARFNYADVACLFGASRGDNQHRPSHHSSQQRNGTAAGFQCGRHRAI
jgi:hypothetical protein